MMKVNIPLKTTKVITLDNWQIVSKEYIEISKNQA